MSYKILIIRQVPPNFKFYGRKMVNYIRKIKEARLFFDEQFFSGDWIFICVRGKDLKKEEKEEKDNFWVNSNGMSFCVNIVFKKNKQRVLMKLFSTLTVSQSTE